MKSQDARFRKRAPAPATGISTIYLTIFVFQIEDEGPEPEKKILVLGLENSGKSSILAQFTAPNSTNSAIAKVTPTEGFNAVNLINEGVSLKIYERNRKIIYIVIW